MAIFKDSEARSWTLSITVAAVKRIREATGANLLDILDDRGAMFGRLHDDPVFLVDMLWAVLAPQAEAREISPEQFAEALAGDVIDQATTAFLESLADFFRRPQQRKAFRELLAKTQSIQTRLEEISLEKISRIDPEALAIELSSCATSSPASPASIPAP